MMPLIEVRVYQTFENDKHMADDRYIYYTATEDAAWGLWHMLCNSGMKHVEVWCNGIKQEPERGLSGVTTYNL